MEISELRLKNLRSLTTKYGVSKLAVQMLGYNQPSYLSTMTSANPQRSFTEKNARKFEIALGFPSGWFDTDHDPVTAPAQINAQLEVDNETIARIADLIRLVGSVCASEEVELTSMKFAEVVALAYTDAMAHAGKPREAHITQLVRLLK